MNKIDGKSMDLTAENIARLKAIFPEAVTEGKVDFDVLKSLLGGEIENRQEYYKFTWNGKEAARQYARQRSMGTLRPCSEESLGADGTPGKFDSENLYIEGDNLEVLKLLQGGYHNSIKLIYIDPPYNTGKDFVYPDNYRDSISNYKALTGQTDDEGLATRANPETSGRYHTDWLNMMYPRLILARNLLTDDGIVFISIDDSEIDNLKKLCNEVFGEENFVACISWQRTYSPRNDSKGIASEVEYLLAYSRNTGWQPQKLPRTEAMNALYKNPDNDFDDWTSSDPFGPGAATHQGMVYAIQHPFTGEMIYPANSCCWRYQQDEMLEIMNGWCHYELRNLHDEQKRAEVCGLGIESIRPDVLAIVLTESLENSRKQAQAIYERGQWPKFYFTSGGIGGIRRKTYLSQVEGKLPTNFWPYEEVGHTDEAKKELKTLFGGNAPFDTPKPVRLLERILSIATDKNSIVMDFFSGSATTAQAVINKNVYDKGEGERRYILIQLPEACPSPDYSNICEIGKERIRRAAKKIREEKPLLAQTQDMGFKVFKLDTSNLLPWNPNPEKLAEDLFAAVNNVLTGRTTQDLLYEILLKCNLPLTLPIEEKKVGDNTVYIVGEGALTICLDETIPIDVAEAIVEFKAEYDPIVSMQVVFRDNGFDDVTKTNTLQILKQNGFDEKSVQTI